MCLTLTNINFCHFYFCWNHTSRHLFFWLCCLFCMILHRMLLGWLMIVTAIDRRGGRGNNRKFVFTYLLPFVPKAVHYTSTTNFHFCQSRKLRPAAPQQFVLTFAVFAVADHHQLSTGGLQWVVMWLHGAHMPSPWTSSCLTCGLWLSCQQLALVTISSLVIKCKAGISWQCPSDICFGRSLVWCLLMSSSIHFTEWDWKDIASVDSSFSIP